MVGARDDHDRSHCARCSNEQLEALYHLNVAAKRYAESASEAYERGSKAEARRRSLRKKALYGLKRSILGTYVDAGCADAVRRHEIDGREYYCVYVGEFSFHSPVDEWDEPPTDAPASATKTLESFEADPDAREVTLSETVALERLTERFESPNHFLETPFVDYEYSCEFAGWSDLPGAVDEGDRVDERVNAGVAHVADSFLFEVGDTFDTRKGSVRILDRYHAWLTPLFRRSPIMPRPAYDLELAGEVRESVAQKQLVDEWHILAESLADPVPGVDGRQAEIVGEHVDEPIEFEIGDVLEIDREWDETGPHFWKISGASVSHSLCFVEFEPIGPTEAVPLPQSIDEFADDVVAVHDSPPMPEGSAPWERD